MSYSEDISLQRKVLIVGLILMGIKVATYLITKSNAILSDALESVVNISSGSFALFGLYVASRPSDKNHPYGHGKIEFISGFIEGVLIIIAGILMVSKGIYNLINPQQIQELLIGMLLTIFTGAINFFMGVVLHRKGKEKNSMIMMSEGIHLQADGYTSLAVLIGLFILWLSGLTWLDNLIAIGFGGYVLYSGSVILKKSVAGIMDEMDMEHLQDILVVLNKNRKVDWIDLHNMRVLRFGRDVHIDCHLTLPWYYDLVKTHEKSEEVALILKKSLDPQTELFIHTDPCVESSCNICQIRDCEVRKHPYLKKIEWNAENLLSNKKHTNQS